MKTYKYQAIDSSGKTISGTHQSISEEATRQYLLGQGNVVLSIKVKKFAFWKRWGYLLLWIPFRKDTVASYLLELLNLTKSGVPVGRSLRMVAESSSNYRIRLLSRLVSRRLQEGEDFWKIMNDYQFCMRRMIPCDLVSKSKSVKIMPVLQLICDQYSQSRLFVTKVFLARIPQLVTLLVSLAFIVYQLNLYISAKFEVNKMFQLNQAYPAYIHITYAFCHFVVSHWVVIVVCFVLFNFIIAFIIKLPYSRFAFDWLATIIFPFSRITKYHQKHVFFRFFIMMTEWGVSFQQVFYLSSLTMTNCYMVWQAKLISDTFSKGICLDIALKRTRLLTSHERFIFQSNSSSQMLSLLRQYVDAVELNLNLIITVISQTLRFMIYVCLVLLWTYALNVYFRVRYISRV